MDTIQKLNLIISIIFILPLVHLSITSKPEARWIYFTMSIGWLAGIIFYATLPFIKTGGHMWSSRLRLVQNVCFGTWPIFTCVEKFFDSDKCKKIKQEILAKVITWIQKLRLLYTRFYSIF